MNCYTARSSSDASPPLPRGLVRPSHLGNFAHPADNTAREEILALENQPVADNTLTAAPTPEAFDIEQPACFYLGREYDLSTKTVLPDKYVMYDARDLTTHGVVVGMTGSGKTGLCISLLEEAALAGVPCIMIDPKGDLTNLLLQFPDLKPEDFARWLNPDDARQKGVPLSEYARRLAEDWKRGLETSGRPPADIARLKHA